MTYLHRDQAGSVVMTTQDDAIADSRLYYAYGSKRGGDEYPFELINNASVMPPREERLNRGRMVGDKNGDS